MDKKQVITEIISFCNGWFYRHGNKIIIESENQDIPTGIKIKKETKIILSQEPLVISYEVEGWEDL